MFCFIVNCVKCCCFDHVLPTVNHILSGQTCFHSDFDLCVHHPIQRVLDEMCLRSKLLVASKDNQVLTPLFLPDILWLVIRIFRFEQYFAVDARCYGLYMIQWQFVVGSFCRRK